MNAITKNYLEKIAKDTVNRAKKLIPFSSNKNFLKEQAEHRVLCMNAMRSQKHFLRENVFSWKINPAPNRAPEKFQDDNLVTVILDNNKKKDMGLFDLMSRIEKLPKLHDKTKHKDHTTCTLLEQTEQTAKKAIKWGIGNCMEHAAVVYCLLIENSEHCLSQQTSDKKEQLSSIEQTENANAEKIPIELISVNEPGDHQFAAIGLAVNSNLNDLSSWGKNAYILDSWWHGNQCNVSEQLTLYKANPKDPKISPAFAYIYKHATKYQCLSSVLKSHIGAGHSQRWQEHRQTKKQPEQVAKWIPRTFSSWNECVPWVESENNKENISERPSPAKKQSTPGPRPLRQRI